MTFLVKKQLWLSKIIILFFILILIQKVWISFFWQFRIISTTGIFSSPKCSQSFKRTNLKSMNKSASMHPNVINNLNTLFKFLEMEMRPDDLEKKILNKEVDLINCLYVLFIFVYSFSSLGLLFMGFWLT